MKWLYILFFLAAIVILGGNTYLIFCADTFVGARLPRPHNVPPPVCFSPHSAYTNAMNSSDPNRVAPIHKSGFVAVVGKKVARL